MNIYQRGLLIGGGLLIAAVQLYFISEDGLDESRGWAGAFLIAILLLFVGSTSDEAISKLLKKFRASPGMESTSRPATSVTPRVESRLNDEIGFPSSTAEGDELAAALRDHLIFAKQQALHDALAGNGKSLKWCCSLSFYASARVAARADNMAIHGMTWNSMVRRFTIEMLESESVGMGDPGYETIEREAYADIETVNRIIDQSEGRERSKIVGYLANAFGCAYRPTASEALDKLFMRNVDRARQRVIPHFVSVFS